MSKNLQKNYLLTRQLYEQANMTNIIRHLDWYFRVLSAGWLIISVGWLLFWPRYNISIQEYLFTISIWYVIHKCVIYYATVDYFSNKLNIDTDFTEYIAQQSIFKIPSFRDYKYIIFLLKIIFRSWIGVRGLYYIYLLKASGISYKTVIDVVHKLNKEINIKKFDALSNPIYLLITGIFLAFCSGVFGAMLTHLFAISIDKLGLLSYINSVGQLFIFTLIGFFLTTKALSIIKTDETKLKELTLFIFWYGLLDEDDLEYKKEKH